MRTQTLALATSIALALTGAAFAQTPAAGGSTEGNMNNPGSVKSNSEKSMESTPGQSGKMQGSPNAAGFKRDDATGSAGTAAPMETAPAGTVAPAR
ncbi:hypothetical protein [Methylobacterium sp. V23]|uniref:hypothetical protein n=1 Tax=Methylobacterium sp. V23 TaxID=2044878 RepID=UPI000CDB591A|nr:hypothetical protein [Methylobacterium sp. V23]POR40073.1 hypothetical protein CRT23_25905 [Methylobacterium sp. V23]